MADPPPISAASPPPISTDDYDSGLPVPPFDAAFFSQSPIDQNCALIDHDCALIDRDCALIGDNSNEFDFNLDFDFDDFSLPSADELDGLLNPDQFPQFDQIRTNLEQLDGNCNWVSSELQEGCGDGDCSADCGSRVLNYAPAGLESRDCERVSSESQNGCGDSDRSSDGFGILNSAPDGLESRNCKWVSSESHESQHGSGDCSGDRSSGVFNSASGGLESGQISGCGGVPSPESKGLDLKSSENSGGSVKVLNYPSPESRGSGNWGDNVSGDADKCVAGAVSSSPDSSDCSIRIEDVDRKVKQEELSRKKPNGSSLKRKKGCDDLLNNGVGSRNYKLGKSSNLENTSSNDNSGGVVSGQEQKRKARLIRNRESAQLSRQRRKHYVEELEEKVRMMNSTIQDLNAKVSYFMAENVTLRQQVGGAGAGAAPPPPIAPPPPGMYPYPPMMYPWMQYPPPYVVKAQGSQVPLVPIPRLKPQKPAQTASVSKKPKIKKVAGVSFLGVLFFIMLFGGLVPMVNLRYGGVREAFTGEESYAGRGMHEKHQGRVLMVNGSDYGEKHVDRRDFGTKSSVQCDQRGPYSGGKPNGDEFIGMSNGTEPLSASLYVPRNDKLVKIDGNLIIHSVLASEKALLSHGKKGGETSLAVPGDLVPAIPVLGEQRSGAMHPQLKALGSGSADKDGRMPKATDGRLQQWFREGLAGPMLSTGMCTEVFQFDVSSASGPIVPATNTRNISEEQNRNLTRLSKGSNRRILRSLPIPLPESSHNSPKENLNGNNSSSPMVVSVLVDPRETGDANVDGVLGKKSVSQIFVVVLIDSVKYVTYSCMLPFKGSTPHLVTT